MKKYLPALIAAFLWIWPAIIIKFLSRHFDNLTQNFYRFLAASIVLVVLNLIWNRENFLKEFRNPGKFLLPTLIIFFWQITWVKTLTLLKPTATVLILRIYVLLVAAFSFFFFRDERRIMKSKAFAAGALLAIAGVAGVILGKSDVGLADFNQGTRTALAGSFLWACYLITVKQILRKTQPLAAVGIIYALTLPLFFVAALFLGNLSKVAEVPPGVNVWLFGSGIFCVGLANAFNFQSIRLIGVTLTSFFVLSTPLFIGIVSYFIFGEVLTALQILSGAVLISGCIVLTRAGEFS